MKPSATEIKLIDKAIEDILEDANWTDREFILYKTIAEKAKKYHKRAVAFNRSQKDRTNLSNYVRDRPWFIQSSHKSYIVNFIESMEIQTLVEEQDNFKLELKFKHPLPPATDKKSHVYVEALYNRQEYHVKISYLDKVDFILRGGEVGVAIGGEGGAAGGTIFHSKIFSKTDVLNIINELLILYDRENILIHKPFAGSISFKTFVENWK